MFAIVLAFFQAAAVRPSPPLVKCEFHPPTPGAVRWEGACGAIFGQTPKMTLTLVKDDSVRAANYDQVTSGRWRSDLEPLEVWAGGMTDGGSPNAAIELDVYAKGETILRTVYGWYAVPQYHWRSGSLAFEIDTSSTVPPSDLDRAIVKRADAILSSAAVWNRADDRRCIAGATTWSIYCAMERATIDVTGAPHHRRPAMELVRTIVEERSAGRNYAHRLMDYNNDPKTTLADVRSLFAEALSRMNAPEPLARSVASASPAAPPPPAATTRQDLDVVDHARKLLGSPSQWNKQEKQRCPADAKTVGIYCALYRSVMDVTGRVDDDNAVLHEARAIIDFVATKEYKARLVNYNNDEATTFADIDAFFRILRNRIVRRMGSAS